ncbi:endonuclease [Priestia megaterium]|uniref:endonuclease n=1 Tax=Priestia megaterium TaxID=1404 RepID=UPI00245282CF|nr:endonuclease [Priestia megaterium]MDH3139415.1 endonuclease [Priestia megaterium]MED4239193.1 endonuclease [Priestia megaterium]MED4256242.1 endonuclease [Priestia megaterium]MED4267523.1 endonuclease [Priestia megaterium]MED4279771.1 endonuclease [Priestia megaterium]
MKLYALCKKPWAISLLVFVLLVSLTPVSQAAAFLSVAQALENQNNSVQTVKGYVVGQPTGTSTVITSNYPNDYALALADSSNETNTDKMVYVQIPSNLRSAFGLQSHSELKGKSLTVTGTLTPYFSHPGIKSVTSTSTETGGTDPAPDPTEPTVPVEDYYRTAAEKTGNSLKTELHNIIDHHTELSYSAVWEALKKTDEDPANANNVILLYTGRSQAKSTSGGGVDDWNREHVWAKSHGDFGTAMGPGTDLHHLRPTDVSVNSTRGNLDFDNGGTEHSEALGNYFDSDSWEPRDEVKGDVARMLFYMAVRYEGDVSDEPDLELNNTVNNGTAPYHGKLSVLLQWNAQDPVDDRERRRNDIIYSDYQHNRNPFIDHPEWVNEIWN